MDSEIPRVWQLLQELSDQLSFNQKTAATLKAQADTLKTESKQTESPFPLRRFSTDVSKETFESELERTSAHLIIENQVLLNENKQLSQLLKEYEGTVETIMSKFRNHALAAQQHESTLIRHYEVLLHTRETQSMTSDMASAAEMAQALQRLSHHLRGLLRSLAGETPDPSDPIYDGSTDIEFDSGNAVSLSELAQLLESLDKKEDDADDGETEGCLGDWATEREVEISRLEQENQELRRMLGIDEESVAASGVTIDLDRTDVGRFSGFLSGGSLRRNPASNDGIINGPKPPFWDIQSHHQLQLPLQQQHPPLQSPLYPGHGGGVPLQRALELQTGMRLGNQGQGRRPGIFGGGARGGRRGGLGGLAGIAPIPGWQPAPPTPLVDRSW